MGRRAPIILSFLGILVGSIFTDLVAQENPPFPIEVELRNEQHLSFGAFTVGETGGKVIIDHSGSRTRSGDVVLLNMGMQKSYAIFDVYGNPGTLIHIQSIQATPLNGPSDKALTLDIQTNRDISTGESFIITSNPHSIFVGGILDVPGGNGSYPGIYHGNMILTLIHE